MIKIHYQMIAPGKKTHINILGKYYKLPVAWDSIYFSGLKHVIGSDEEDCLNRIRGQLKRKYEGFVVRKVEGVSS